MRNGGSPNWLRLYKKDQIDPKWKKRATCQLVHASQSSRWDKLHSYPFVHFPREERHLTEGFEHCRPHIVAIWLSTLDNLPCSDSGVIDRILRPMWVLSANGRGNNGPTTLAEWVRIALTAAWIWFLTAVEEDLSMNRRSKTGMIACKVVLSTVPGTLLNTHEC